MIRWSVTFIVMFLSVCTAAFAQSAGSRYLDYIEKYAPLAVRQMELSGIPASITLAQGLLESAAGTSTLAREGNNHFGIKCAGWTGKTMLRDDDEKDECFRAYDSVDESFADHSAFLKKKRYASLFELDKTDYAGWAAGLSRCGYATDPHYAERLITIIETYSLYRYDGTSDGDDVADFIIATLQKKHPVRTTRKLHYVVAAPGDTYGTIAAEFDMKTEDLLLYNDAATDGGIRAWEEVYLQPKHDNAPRGTLSVTIGEDENMRTVAQRFAIKLSTLKKLNPGAADVPGTLLKLR